MSVLEFAVLILVGLMKMHHKRKNGRREKKKHTVKGGKCNGSPRTGLHLNKTNLTISYKYATYNLKKWKSCPTTIPNTSHSSSTPVKYFLKISFFNLLYLEGYRNDHWTELRTISSNNEQNSHWAVSSTLATGPSSTCWKKSLFQQLGYLDRSFISWMVDIMFKLIFQATY